LTGFVETASPFFIYIGKQRHRTTSHQNNQDHILCEVSEAPGKGKKRRRCLIASYFDWIEFFLLRRV